MITRRELKELASLMLKDDLFVSLYLDVDPTTNPKSEWLLHFKNLARDALAGLGKADAGRIRGDLERIERFLNDRPEGMKRGMVVFSARGGEFWRVYHTNFPFINQLVIENDPYIKPLAAMLDLHQRYLVTVVGGTRARLFLAELGRLQELSTVSRKLAGGDPLRDGGSGDKGAERAKRQKENIQRLLFKDVESVVEKTLRDEGGKRMLLGGSDNARGRFKDAVSEKLLRRIVGEFTVDREAGPAEILDRCLPVMREVEFRFERKALRELFDKTGAREGSVLGLSDVLTALQQGNVRKIYAMANMTTPGMVCRRCGALTPERDRNCPYCGGEMERVDHMIDLAIQKAIDQGARVDMLDDSPELAKAGGIGALMRY